MFLDKMKWPEVAALQRDKVLVVCCISALEQHSLHLPMGTDYFIGTELVRRLEAHDSGRLLCLPTMWLGASGHHMDFAGTISASISTMLHVLHDIASSVQSHGFRKLLLLNSHGGNRSLLGCSVQDLGAQFPDLTIVGTTYWEVAKDELSRIRETEYGGMGHACELETSIILAISGELVDMSRARRDGTISPSVFTREEMLSVPLVGRYKSTKESSCNGGYGDPEHATSEKGNHMLEAIVQRLAALCEEILDDKL